MAFVPYRGPKGCFDTVKLDLKASAAFTKGDTYLFSSGGYADVGVAASAVLRGVILETVTASATDGATTAVGIPFRDGQEWIVDTTDAPTQTLIGQNASLTNVRELDEDDTGNTPLFQILGIYGAAANKKVRLRPVMALLTGSSA